MPAASNGESQTVLCETVLSLTRGQGPKVNPGGALGGECKRDRTPKVAHPTSRSLIFSTGYRKPKLFQYAFGEQTHGFTDLTAVWNVGRYLAVASPRNLRSPTLP